MYVVDKGGRIQRLSQVGEYLTAWRMPEIAAGKPTGLGIAPDGRVFAADTHYSRVMIFDAEGALLQSVGEYGDEGGQFRLPTDVAIDDDGFIYVAEYGGNDRISKFTADWRYLFSFGTRDSGAAALNRPQSMRLAPDGTLWVADAAHHRVVRFSTEGEFLGAFGRLGSGPGELRFPYCVDVLPDGTLAVCEYGNNRVQRFTADGRSLGTWGAAGRELGRLAYPWALLVGAKGRLLVIDSGNNRAQVIAGLADETWQ